jgi:mono/diheme cytochrome c family protein
MFTLKLGLLSASLLASPLFAQADNVARGKYLVEEVARCQECHTPKTADGKFDETKWLKGATLNIQPIEETKGWHKTSPDLTSTSRLWQSWKEAGILKFLTTGLNPRGRPADAPMPMYKLRPDDAQAIVDYLKSLK